MNDLIDRFNSVPLAQKILVLFLVMAAILTGFFMLLYQPTVEDIDRLQRQVSTLEQEEERLQRIRRSQADLEAQLEELNRQLQVAQEKLPRSAEIPNLLQRVYNQAQTDGLTIENFQRNQEVVRSDYIEIPVQLELTGSFDEVAYFFYYVGQMPRIINFENITIDRQSRGATPDGQLTVRARATTYRWNPDAAG